MPLQKRNRHDSVAALRKRAEKQLPPRESAPREALSPEQSRRVLHELQVHQIELEMQNEELRRAQAELDASRERYFDLYDLAPVGYCTLSEKGLILEANLTAAQLLGVGKGALLHQPFTRFIAPEDQDLYYKHRRALFKTGAPRVSELRLKKMDGALFWGRIDSTPSDSPAGLRVCRATICDITSRRQAEEALEQANRELEQRVMERTEELNRVNRTLFVLNECNESLMSAKNEQELLNEICRIIVENGAALMAWIGMAENDPAKSVRTVTQVGGDNEYLKKARVRWADVPRGRGPVGAAIRTRKVVQCLNIAENPGFAPWREGALQRGYGAAIGIPLVWEEKALGALCIYTAEISGFGKEEVKLLERLAKHITYGLVALRTHAGNEYLQDELLRISEREKQLIAQELHDGLCQNLAGTALMSRTLRTRLEARNDPDSKYAREICELLNTGVNEARNLSHGLHPVGPDGEGLMNALAQLANTVCNLFHIRCTFHCPEPVILPNEIVSTHLFRITQEAINNARKHGEADEVVIGLVQTPRGTTLTIADNGVGIPAKLPKKSGMGLRIMNHRASDLGATVSIRRAGKKGGTVVTCTVPC